MAAISKIEWTDATFNPVIGCTKISEGCENCYADDMNQRWHAGANWGPGAPRKRTSEAYWRQPLKWNQAAEKAGKRAKVFCASLADVMDNEWPEDVRPDLFNLIKATPHLDWLLLTKRPQNFKKFLPDDWGDGYKNVGLGVSAENQTELERRIIVLHQTKARMKFLSCEPLLGMLDVEYPESCNPVQMCCGGHECGCFGRPTNPPLIYGIDWVIAGGESGPKARPMKAEWARRLRDDCKEHGIPFFFKQWGEHNLFGERVGKKVAGRLLDGVEHSAFYDHHKCYTCGTPTLATYCSEACRQQDPF